MLHSGLCSSMTSCQPSANITDDGAHQIVADARQDEKQPQNPLAYYQSTNIFIDLQHFVCPPPPVLPP